MIEVQGLDEVRIRPAAANDLEGLVRIYNHYVVNTHITFDVTPFSVEQRRAWFDRFSGSGPHRLMVAEVDARPVGYASSGKFAAKPAYDRSVETTIYLAPAFVGRGIGHRLYGALLEALDATPGVHRAYGGVALPNPKSIALHERLGFKPAGTFHSVGFKLGRYWDVRWYERPLAGDASLDEA